MRRTEHQFFQGMAIVELLIMISIHLSFFDIFIGLYLHILQSLKLTAEARHIQYVGNFALMILGREIQMAGFAPLGEKVNYPAVLGCAQGEFEPTVINMCRMQDTMSDAIQIRYMALPENSLVISDHEVTDCLGHGIKKIAVKS